MAEDDDAPGPNAGEPPAPAPAPSGNASGPAPREGPARRPASSDGGDPSTSDEDAPAAGPDEGDWWSDGRALGWVFDESARGRGSLDGLPSAPGSRTAFGNRGPVAQGDSAPAIGGNVGVINIGGGARLGLRARLLDPGTVNELSASFVDTLADGTTSRTALAALLRSSPVVILAGPVGSGRAALATCALFDTMAGGQLARFDPDVDAAALTAADLRANVGYVVLANGAARRGQLGDAVAELTGLARDKGARLVLVVDDRHADRARGAGPMVEHRLPDREHVLRELLRQRHRMGGDLVVRLPEPVGAAVADASLSRVAEVAALVAAAVGLDQPPAAFLDGSTRNEVSRKFESPLSEGEERGELTEPERVFRRALLVAVAVCNDMSIDVITTVAVHLARFLRAAQEEEEQPGQPFTETTRALLGFVGATPVEPEPAPGASGGPAEATAAEPPSARPPEENRVRLRNPAVARATLEVVWQEFHLARASLLQWLDELAVLGEDRRAWPEPVRLRAALAVGRLASLDFDLVVRERIEPWVRRNVTGRRAAAWAVEEMIGNPRTADRAWELVGSWQTRGRDWRTAALLVYATGLGSRRTDAALRAVRREAGSPSSAGSLLVPLVVHAVAANGAIEQVFELLTDWLDDVAGARDRTRRLRRLGRTNVIVRSPVDVQAARCLLLLSDRKAGGGTRLALVEHARADEGRWERFEALWQLALARPGKTQLVAWRLLRHWLEEADTDAGQARVVGDLLTGLVQGPPGTQICRHLVTIRNAWDHDGAFPVASALVTTIITSRGAR